MCNILIVDVGTSSMRGILYDETGTKLYKSQQKYFPIYMNNGWVEQDPNDWKDALIKIINEIVEKTKIDNMTIDTIGITSQRTSIIPVDRFGEPMCNAIMWQDKRTYEVCKELEKENQHIYFKTGIKVESTFTAPKIYWLKKNKPEIYNNAYKIIVIPDYLIFLLTGKYVTDHTYGSRTLLMNIYTKQWDQDLFNYFQIDKEKLCDLVAPGSICGYITDKFAKKTGLQSNIPVITAGGDQQCAALGLHVFGKGTIEVTSGTGSFIIACDDVPKFDDQMRTMCQVSAIPNKYNIEAAIPTTSTIYHWFNDNFYNKSKEQKYIFQMINNEASSSPVGSNGLMMLPHFQGSYSNSLAKGLFFNISLGIKRGDFARAILEGIALEIEENIQLVEKMTTKVESIYVAGGLTKFHLYNQIQADVFRKKIICYDNEEASALGAWVSSVKTLGLYNTYEEAFDKANNGVTVEFNSNELNAGEYNKLKIRRKALYDALNQSGVYSLFSKMQ